VTAPISPLPPGGAGGGQAIRDYLNPNYPPALCDADERTDRLAHFAQSAAPASNLASTRNRWSGALWAANDTLKTIFAIIGAMTLLAIVLNRF